MNTFLEQSEAQSKAIKMLLPKKEQHNTPIIIAIVERFAEEMREVLNKNPHATSEQIIQGIGEIEHQDPMVIVDNIIGDNKK